MMEPIVNKKRGALNGFFLWLLMIVITYILLVLLSDMFGGIVFVVIVLLVAPFILAGYHCWHNKKRKRIFIMIYVFISFVLYLFLLTGVYAEKIKNRHGTYFNLESQYMLNDKKEGCLKQFNRDYGIEGKKALRSYLRCDYSAEHTALDTLANRKLEIVGKKTKYDCHCEYTQALLYY